MNKPAGLTVILPEEAKGMLEGLPVETVHGIRPATTKRLHELNVYTGADLKRQTLEGLKNAFSKAGEHSTTSP